MLRRILLSAIALGLFAAAPAQAGVQLTTVGHFAEPTYITAPPGDTHRLFVVEQPGVIMLIKDGGAPTTFLDISSKVTYVGGEQGLLSMAFAPNYATTHRFFVYYTSTSCPQPTGCDERVSEFTADSGGDTARASSEQVLMTIPHPTDSNHNGGQLQFGPDGDLYIGVGDGGDANDTHGNAQPTDRLLGKILRIAPGTTSYSIPPGNPFSGGALCRDGSNGGSNCPEIWAYGVRNPWRFSFDRVTGDLVIADVGQDGDEEIDYAHPGQNARANYGWPCYEGFELNALRPDSECSPLPSPVVAPVLAYNHPENCDPGAFCGEGIIGGYVMHDPTLPSLDGCYVYGDLNNPELRVARLAEPAALSDADLGVQVSSLSSFGLDASGHLYAADVYDGTMYRLDSDGNAATDPTCASNPGVDHIGVSAQKPQHAGASFTITAKAFNSAGRVVSTFNGPATFTDISGTLSGAPTSFTNGVAQTSSATVATAFTHDQVTVTSGTDSGQSEVFNVYGPLDHVLVSVLRPVNANTPFTIVARAYDSANNLLVDFNGPASFSDRSGEVSGTPTSFTNGVAQTSNATVADPFHRDQVTVTSGSTSAQSSPFNVYGPLDHFSVVVPAGPLLTTDTFTVTAIARDSAGNVLTGYSGSATWSDASGSLSPATPSDVVGGISQTTGAGVSSPWKRDRITVGSGGKTGTSAAFDVNAPN